MDKFCRCCLTIISDSHQIAHDIERKRKQFIYVTGIRVSYNDVYPFEICEECTQALQLSSEFKKKCRKLDKYLKNYINVKGDWDTLGFLTYVDDIEKNRLDTSTKKDCYDDESVCTSVRNFMSEIVKEEDICGSDDIIDAVIKEGIDLDDTIDSCWLQGNQNTSITTQLEKCFSPYLTPSGNSCPEKTLIDPTLMSKENGLKQVILPKVDFDSYSAVESTLCEVPRDTSTPLRIVILDKENDNDIRDKYKYECTWCEEKFMYFTKYQSHCSEIHNVKISKKPNRKPKTCEHCGKVFTDPSNLRRHLQKYMLKENNTECEICKLDFKTPHAYKLHRRAHNTRRIGVTDDNSSDKNKKKYVCSVCGAIRTNYPNLLAHQKKHKEKWPYSCKICDKPFYRMYDLNRHKRRHTGEKPYECKVCSMRFIRSDKLMEHMRTHNDERPYVCIVCDQDFVSLSGLRQHKPQCKRLENMKNSNK